MNLKQKKKFKLPTAFTILFIIIAILVLISWILKWTGATFDSTIDLSINYNDVSGEIGSWILNDDFILKNSLSADLVKNINEALNANGGFDFGSMGTFIYGVPSKENINATGIIDIFYAIILGFVGKTDIIAFILILGGFIMIVMNTKALEAFTQSVTKKLGKNTIWIIPILMLFFSFCGSTYGMAEESLGFYMLVIPLMLSTMYDKFTGFIIILFGAGSGVLASTVNPFVIQVAIQAAGTDALTASDGMAWRWITWIIITAIAIAYVMIYAIKVKKNPEKSVTFNTLEGDKVFYLGEVQEQIPFTKRRIASLIIFLFSFVIMVFYMVSWDTILGKDNFENAGNWMNQNIPYITGLIPGFGMGGLAEVAVFFFVASLIIGIINWGGEAQYVDSMINGAKDLLSVCLIIGTAAGVGIILERTGMQILIVNGLTNGIAGMNSTAFIIVSFLIFLPLSFLIPSTSGFAAAIFPIWGPLAISVGAGSGTILSFSMASGILNLFTPTSGVVMGALAISKIEYGDFLKGSWKFILIMAASSIILLSVGSLLPSSIF